MLYVYVYRDPRPTKNNQPVYVGKGTGDRDVSHWSRGSHNKPFQDFMSHLRQKGLALVPQRVFETPDETAAFAKEIELIALYGRRNIGAGTLFNLTDGGEGGSGTVWTTEQKAAVQKQSIDKWQRPEYREKVVAAQKAGNQRQEVKEGRAERTAAMWGVQHEHLAGAIKKTRNTDASKEKTSAQAKAQWADPAYAAKQTANNQEIANRAEVKAAKAAAAKALWADPVWKAKMLAARAKK
jgi:hypothetical protein